MKAAPAAALLALVACTPPCWAYSDYPEKPVRIVIGATPGHPNDILTRVMIPALSDVFKQRFIVDNHPGASGNLAAARVANAAPDGYTLLVVSAPFATSVSIYPKLGYDPQKSFAPVARIASWREVIVVNASRGMRSVSDLSALIRARPGTVTIASAGTATTSHLVGELFKIRAGWLDALHVPYRSHGFALAGLLGEHVDALIATVTSVRPHVATGRLKALAVTSAERSELMPGVPTLAEAGYPGVEASGWTGVVAPAGTPYEAIVRLNVALAEITKAAATRARFKTQGADAMHETAEAFTNYLHAEIEKWSKVVKAAGVAVD